MRHRTGNLTDLGIRMGGYVGKQCKRSARQALYQHTIDKKYRYDKDGRDMEILIEYLTMLECWAGHVVLLQLCFRLAWNLGKRVGLRNQGGTCN
jgi:hypothetical protein